MTPSARVAAAIELLATLEEQCFVPEARRRPADAVASDFFRARRFIGGGDRRAVSELAWGVVRQRLRLVWHLERIGMVPTPRLLLLAQLLLVERRAKSMAEAEFDDTRYGPAALDPAERRAAAALAGRALLDPAMPEGPRLNLPDWLLPELRVRFGDALAREASGLEAEASLDLRANLLKGDRGAAAAALAAEGIATTPTGLSPWGLRLSGRRPVTGTAAFRTGMIEVQDEGSQLIALLVDARPGMRVADYCAGAAGKTLAMAATMGKSRQDHGLRYLRHPAGGSRATPEARRRRQCRTAPAGAWRPMGQTPRRHLRPGAGGRALYRDRHLAAQS